MTTAKLSNDERLVITEYDNLIAEIVNKRAGALQMLVRQRKLEGSWRYADGELIRIDQPAIEAPEEPVAPQHLTFDRNGT